MDERLRKFAVLVEIGSYTEAARRLHVSQPSLSVAVHKLERELGVTLLLRGSHDLRLTPAGRQAYNTAKELMMVTANLRTQLQSLSRDRPKVRIGMIDSVARLIFASDEFAGRLEQRVQFSVVINNSSFLLEAVRRDELDLALIAGQLRRPAPGLDVTALADETMVFVCHPADSDIFQQQIADGAALPFMSYDHASNTYRLIQHNLQSLHIETDVVFASTSPEIILELVRRRKAAAVLPFDLVHDDLSSGALAIIRHPNPITVHRPIVRAIRQGKSLPSEIDDLFPLLSGLLADQAAAVRRLSL